MKFVPMRLAVVGLMLSTACSDAGSDDPATPSTTPSGTTSPTGQTATQPTNPSVAGDASTTSPSGPVAPNGDGGIGGTTSDDGSVTPITPVPPGQVYNYVNQTVALSSDLVVPAGMTVTVGPGVTFNAATGVKIQVNGELVVSATADAPSHFMGSGSPKSWAGIVVASGGKLTLTHAEVGGANFGVHALPGSSYTIDYTSFNTSFKAAVLESTGSIDHSKINAAPSFGFAVTNEVSADDINGTVTIIAASPTVSNSEFIGASGLVDLVRIGGNSTPVFDHVHLTSAHCGFHNNGAVNNSPRVTNSIIENMSYGVMAYTSKPVFENCIFRKNQNDVGNCDGATAANLAVLTNNFYPAGSLAVDQTCNSNSANVHVTEPHPATTAPAGAGPVGL